MDMLPSLHTLTPATVRPPYCLAFTSSFTCHLFPNFVNSTTPLRKPSIIMPPAPCAQQIQPPSADNKAPPPTGQVRLRQHLNPLARRWSQPVSLPSDWYSRAFKDPSLPLIVDVGVAKGRFLLKLANTDPTHNFLGLEIREPLVHQANRCAYEAGLTNLFYVACNANVSLKAVLNDAPRGVLDEIYIQFCDPWFKKRHAKRRMVNAPLVNDVFQALKESAGTEGKEKLVFVQSDVLEVAREMRDLFDHHDGFKRVGKQNEDGWLLENPIGVPTEREIAVLGGGGNVYRVTYVLRRWYSNERLVEVV